MAIKSLEINSKEIHLMKSVTSADYSGKTVLTNSSWEYVDEDFSIVFYPFK